MPAAAWVIIPVHNRRELTLRCLDTLHRNGDSARFRVLVIDDGSTDGTAGAIHARFPAVEVTSADGTLWWTGAVVLGMKRAMDAGADAVFWLNDDCHPQPGALDLLLARATGENCLAAAQPHTPVGLIFSGLRKTATALRPVPADGGRDVTVDACNGNCVCIPRTVVERVGYPDAAAFPQYHGDTDYTLRATRAGFRCVIVGAAQCRSEMPPSPNSESWLLSEKPFAAHWQKFRQAKSPYYFPAYYQLNRRHWGLWGIVLFCRPYVRLAVMRLVRAVMPRALFNRFLGSRSLYWRMRQTTDGQSPPPE